MDYVVEHLLVAYFRDHHGVIPRSQAVALGLTSDQIQRKLRTGQWQKVHRGVYRARAAPETFEQLAAAACLAAGPHSIASHGTAVWLRGLSKRPPEIPSVSVPAGSRPRLRGVDEVLAALRRHALTR